MILNVTYHLSPSPGSLHKCQVTSLEDQTKIRVLDVVNAHLILHIRAIIEPPPLSHVGLSQTVALDLIFPILSSSRVLVRHKLWLWLLLLCMCARQIRVTFRPWFRLPCPGSGNECTPNFVSASFMARGFLNPSCRHAKCHG